MHTNQKDRIMTFKEYGQQCYFNLADKIPHSKSLPQMRCRVIADMVHQNNPENFFTIFKTVEQHQDHAHFLRIISIMRINRVERRSTTADNITVGVVNSKLNTCNNAVIIQIEKAFG